MAAEKNINKLIDHLFRRESGKMIAVLTRIFGTENLALAEDVVQDTLLRAFEVWSFKGIPPNPTAWLFRAARNKAIDVLRRGKHVVPLDEEHDHSIIFQQDDEDTLWQEELVKDDMLRMMFACCHPVISQESQVVLILKTLCGFSTAEISKAFMLAEDTVSKRLYRTKEFFRQQKIKLVIPSVNELKDRTDAVLRAVYLLFNEGYNSTNHETLIRKDLISEAILLAKLLTDNENTRLPETYALLALMCFQASRSESRLTPEGDVILLPNQDKSKWDFDLIAEGNDYMNKAAFGDVLSTYHLEAAIAFEHCAAPSFAQTNWQRILQYYNGLLEMNANAFIIINRAVAVLQVNGPATALETLEMAMADRKKLEGNYLYHAVLGEIYTRLHDAARAKESFETAIRLTNSAAEKRMLAAKLAKI